MPELDSLINEMPEGLKTDGEPIEDDNPTGGGAGDDDDPEEEEIEEESEEEEPAAGGEEDEPEEDEEFDVDLDEDEEPTKLTVETPAGAPKAAATDEGQYILENLPKIKTNVLIAGADGKDQIRAVEVYGWGQLRSTPGFKGFATPIDQTDFVIAANNNEQKATQLQNEFRTNKMKADGEAYTIKENRAVANDLKQLRQEGLFPKFKGMPGTPAFNNSDGAKEFDKVIAFMNEQNDEAGRAANAGGAFYHISFRQAYRMLHPEQFDKTALDKKRKTEKAVARRVKTGGGGSKPERNVQPSRVSNIMDLADEFASFAGTNK